MNTGLGHCLLALALPCYSSLELLIPPEHFDSHTCTVGMAVAEQPLGWKKY